MSSPKRHVFLSLLFILKCFSKPYIINNNNNININNNNNNNNTNTNTNNKLIFYEEACNHLVVAFRRVL